MTDFIRLVLEWVRAALRGRRTPGRHRTQDAPAYPQELSAPSSARSLYRVARAARLDVRAGRWRRAVRAAQANGTPYLPPYVERADAFPPRDWEAEEAWERTGALVWPYVGHLGAAPRNAGTDTWAGPRGNAR